MKRRKFVATAGMGTVLSSCAAAGTIINNQEPVTERAFYEWRSYEMKWGVNASKFMTYLKESLKPALIKAGANSVVIYREINGTTPNHIHVQVSFPNAIAYQNSLGVTDTEEFIMANKEYDATENPAYLRNSTSLLHAFKGMPQLRAPIEGAGLYELRIYEGRNEDAVRRKIRMFDTVEIQLFLDLQLQPIFFGEMIAGPYMPCLVYMLNFRDKAHKDEAWAEFIADARWKEMSSRAEFANTVSNIRNIFLEKA